MASKTRNTVYLVETGPGEIKSFDNWPACQGFVQGKPFAFAGGADYDAALAKLKGSRDKQKPKAKPRNTREKQKTDAKPRNTIYLVEVAEGELKTFHNWPACQKFVKGKAYAFAGGVDRDAAMDKLMDTREKQYAWKNKGGGGASPRKAAAPALPLPTVGITSDCGTHGNPGPCEYQVTDLQGKVLAHKHLGVHTNNYAELAGIEAMIDCALDREETVMWTDSKISMGWIKSNKLGPTVKEPELILEMIGRIRVQLRKHPQLKLQKWDTRNWGQIPSDFGRK